MNQYIRMHFRCDGTELCKLLATITRFFVRLMI